jgi:hypothetical protein
MLRAMSLTMCLMLPMTAFAQDVVAPPADAPAAAPSLAPATAAPPNPVTEGTRWCGMSHGCSRKGSIAKVVVIGGVVGVVVTAVAVSIAVGVANAQQPTQVAR